MRSHQHHEKVRAAVMCIFRYEDKLLVCGDYDPVKKETFYRPPGGGIEFQEPAADALRRELKEEFGVEIINEKYIKTIENIFVWEGSPGHEIILLFEAEFTDKSFYEKEHLISTEAGHVNGAWIPVDEFTSERLILYPVGLIKLL